MLRVWAEQSVFAVEAVVLEHAGLGRGKFGQDEVVQGERVVGVVWEDEAVFYQEEVVGVRAVGYVDFFACFCWIVSREMLERKRGDEKVDGLTIIPICENRVSLSVALRVAAVVRVIEVVHEGAHGVAVIGCEEGALFGEAG